jgi:hypothetical protein
MRDELLSVTSSQEGKNFELDSKGKMQCSTGQEISILIVFTFEQTSKTSIIAWDQILFLNKFCILALYSILYFTWDKVKYTGSVQKKQENFVVASVKHEGILPRRINSQRIQKNFFTLKAISISKIGLQEKSFYQ